MMISSVPSAAVPGPSAPPAQPSSPVTPAPAAAPAPAPADDPASAPAQAAASAGQPTTVEQNQTQFRQLTSILLDDTGSYTEAQQGQAYAQLHTMAVTGGLAWISPNSDDDQLRHAAQVNSAAAQKATSMFNSMEASVQSAIATTGQNEAAGSSMYGYITSLSSDDQDFFFNTTLNPTWRDGTQTYTSLNDLLSQLMPGAAAPQAKSAGSTVNVTLSPAASVLANAPSKTQPSLDGAGIGLQLLSSRQASDLDQPTAGAASSPASASAAATGTSQDRYRQGSWLYATA